MYGIYDDSFYESLCTLLDGKKPATQFILGSLLGGGLLISGALFPNVLKAFAPRHKKYQKVYKDAYSAKKIQNTLYYLKKQKYITVLRKKNGYTEIRITAHGKKHMTKILAHSVCIPQPNTWDGKWHVVLFDIPLEKNHARNALRRKIKELHFFQLQKSVWVYPYPCEDEILFIAHEYDVEENIEIFTAEKLLHEKDVRTYFKL